MLWHLGLFQKPAARTSLTSYRSLQYAYSVSSSNVNQASVLVLLYFNFFYLMCMIVFLAVMYVYYMCSGTPKGVRRG